MYRKLFAESRFTRRLVVVGSFCGWGRGGRCLVGDLCLPLAVVVALFVASRSFPRRFGVFRWLFALFHYIFALKNQKCLKYFCTLTRFNKRKTSTRHQITRLMLPLDIDSKKTIFHHYFFTGEILLNHLKTQWLSYWVLQWVITN